MTPRGDDGEEMPPAWSLDDETIDAIVAGEHVDARFDQLVAFARQVEALGEGAPPPASPALEAVLAGPRPDGRRSRPRPGALTVAAARLAGLGAAARVGLGTAVAAVVLVGAGAAGVLPAQANERVRGAIEVVTPVDFGDDKTPDTITGGDPAGHGGRVSSDATGESDGLPGVDGGDVSGESPGSGRRPAGHGDGDGAGRDRPRDTRPEPQGNGHANRDRADDEDDDGDEGDEGDDRDGDQGNGPGRENAPGPVRRQTTTTTAVRPPTTVPAPAPPAVPGQGAEED